MRRRRSRRPKSHRSCQPPVPKVDDADPSVCIKWKPDGPEWIGEMTVECGRRDRHRRSAEHGPGVRFTSFAREAEQNDIWGGRRPGEDAVALHLVFEPVSRLGSEV